MFKFITPTEFEEEIRCTPKGFPSGFKEIDRQLLLEPGTITTVTGYTSHGKSAFMQNVALNLTKSHPNHTHVYLTYEHTSKQLLERFCFMLLGKEANYPNHTVAREKLYDTLKDEERANEPIAQSYSKLITLLKENKLRVTDSKLSVVGICNALKLLRDEVGERLGVVFLDHLHQLDLSNFDGQSHDKLADAMKMLLAAVHELDISLVLASQGGRVTKMNEDLTPQNLVTYGSKAIKQNTDTHLNVELDKAKARMTITSTKARSCGHFNPVELGFDGQRLKLYSYETSHR